MTPDQGDDAGWALEALRAREADLEASRLQIAGLARELEETNRGIIALHAELEGARQAEAQLAAIVRSSGDAMVSMDLDGIIQTWNPGAEHLFGYRAAEITGRPFSLLVPAGLREEFGEILQRVRGGAAETHDTRRLRKDGSPVDVAVTLSAIRDAAGALAGVSAVSRDITDRLRADAELAAARAEREILAERDRIARDLHDRAIQRIFAAGMALQSAASLGSPQMAARLQAVIGELDASIDEIRQAIFALQHPHGEPSSLRAQVLAAAAGAGGALGFAPDVSFSGPVRQCAGGRQRAPARRAPRGTVQHRPPRPRYGRGHNPERRPRPGPARQRRRPGPWRDHPEERAA